MQQIVAEALRWPEWCWHLAFFGLVVNGAGAVLALALFLAHGRYRIRKEVAD